MKTAAIVLTILMTCILQNAKAQTQAPPNAISGPISGTVQDQTGALIPNAQIQLLTAGNTPIAYVAIDESPKLTGAAKFDDAFEVRNNDFLIKEKSLPSHHRRPQPS